MGEEEETCALTGTTILLCFGTLSTIIIMGTFWNLIPQTTYIVLTVVD